MSIKDVRTTRGLSKFKISLRNGKKSEYLSNKTNGSNI